MYSCLESSPKMVQQEVNLYAQLFQLPQSYYDELDSPAKKHKKPSILTQFILKKIQNTPQHPWNILGAISHLIQEFIQDFSKNYQLQTQYATPNHNSHLYHLQGSVHFVNPQLIFIGKGTVIEHGSMITGPCIIGQNCQLRHGTYIRGNVILSDFSILGNSSQVKNSILMDYCQIAHFNYIGDSILGIRAHFSAGAIISNFKLDGSEIKIALKISTSQLANQGKETERKRILETGRNKLGALVGHNVEIGCNAILNPGSIIGRNSVIYPLVNWRGYLEANKICKLVQHNLIVEKQERK